MMHCQWVGTIHRGVVQPYQRGNVKTSWLVFSSRSMKDFLHWLKMSFCVHVRWVRVPLGQLITETLYKTESNLKAKIIYRWILPFHAQLEKPLFYGRTMKDTGHVSCFSKCAKTSGHCNVPSIQGKEEWQRGLVQNYFLLSQRPVQSVLDLWPIQWAPCVCRWRTGGFPNECQTWLEATHDASWDTSKWSPTVDGGSLWKTQRAGASAWGTGGIHTQNGTGRHGCPCLEQFDDFKYELSAVALYLIQDLKHHCIFLLKVFFDTQLLHQLIRCTNISIAISFLQFHPELNPIERCWGRAKKYARSTCNYSFPSLKVIVPQALAVVSIDLIRKYSVRSATITGPT